MLFMEGQKARGAFVLCTGKAKLSTTSRDGRTIITKMSEHGDVLGLSATISHSPYEVTAEMIEPGQANFISADVLLYFLRDYGEVALRVAQQLSHNYRSAYGGIRTLALNTLLAKGLPNSCWSGQRNGETQAILYICVWF